MDFKHAIEIRNMSKYFKVQYDHAKTLKDLMVSHGRGKVEKHVVLKDISLNINKGETVALIGANGSGKSTLLKLMTRIIYPNSGTVETNGKLTSLLELGAGFHPDFTGRENIYFNAAIFGLNEKEINKRIDEIIEFSELGSAIDEPIRTYSSGMYMRLAFSIAINVDAEILLIDEILAVGDQHFQEKCYAKLKELKSSDKTIVIVSHTLGVVKDLCTRAIWIYKGELKLDGDPIYVIDEYLKQVAIDNRAEKMQTNEAGENSYKGAIFFDEPKDFAFIQNTDGKGHLMGWQLSDCEKSKFQVFIGAKELKDIESMDRPDVFSVYQEEYSGYINSETLGWNKYFSWADYADQFDANGHVTITAQILDDQNTVIVEKSITVTK